MVARGSQNDMPWLGSPSSANTREEHVGLCELTAGLKIASGDLPLAREGGGGHGRVEKSGLVDLRGGGNIREENTAIGEEEGNGGCGG